jgi:hypothetical protein
VAVFHPAGPATVTTLMAIGNQHLGSDLIYRHREKTRGALLASNAIETSTVDRFCRDRDQTHQIDVELSTIHIQRNPCLLSDAVVFRR